MRKLFAGSVLTLIATLWSCGGTDTRGVTDESETSQAVTQCELDCPSGQVLTCDTVPCSVTATSLTCNGVTTNCCTPRTCSTDECGEVPDGCGGVLQCGGCDTGHSCVDNACLKICPVGKFDCCNDDHCWTPTQCNLLGC